MCWHGQIHHCSQTKDWWKYYWKWNITSFPKRDHSFWKMLMTLTFVPLKPILSKITTLHNFNSASVSFSMFSALYLAAFYLTLSNVWASCICAYMRTYYCSVIWNLFWKVSFSCVHNEPNINGNIYWIYELLAWSIYMVSGKSWL